MWNSDAGERTRLVPEGPRTFYRIIDSTPPPYSPNLNNTDRGYQNDNAYQETYRREPSRISRVSIMTCCFVVTLFVLVPYLALGIYFSDLPTKISQWKEYMDRIHKQERAMQIEAQHLESERIALRDQCARLETERQSLEKQELALKEERERWEKARDELTIPKGAFWEVVWPAWDCRAYGEREYWGILRNIPAGRDEMDACMNMPVEIKGVTIRRPYRCQYVRGSIHGFWMVNWDQPDCKPWHQDFVDRGCTNLGSGFRRIEAEVVGMNEKGGQDWRLLCETTPMIWNRILYTSPAHCEDHGRKIAAWDVPDGSC